MINQLAKRNPPGLIHRAVSKLNHSVVGLCNGVPRPVATAMVQAEYRAGLVDRALYETCEKTREQAQSLVQKVRN